MWRDPSGRKHPLTERVLNDMLKSQPKGPDGAYRALASRWIEGDAVGPFSYRSARTDEPERHSAPRGPADASRHGGVLLLAEPPRYAVDQHDGYVGIGRRPPVPEALSD